MPGWTKLLNREHRHYTLLSTVFEDAFEKWQFSSCQMTIHHEQLYVHHKSKFRRILESAEHRLGSEHY